MYEEWIAHPRKRAYVKVDDHASYANRPGWWLSGWTGDELQAKTLKSKQKALPKDEEEPAA